MADDRFGHILGEGAADKELLAALGGVAVGRGQPEAQGQGEPPAAPVGPQAGPEGQDRQGQVRQEEAEKGGQGDAEARKERAPRRP